MAETGKVPTELFEQIKQALEGAGVEIKDFGSGHQQVKVIAVPANLKDSLSDLTRSARDQVVMVRLDQDTLDALDTWIETEVVGSRSEAAALFIRQGLDVRRAELEQLKDSLSDFKKARSKLREKAKKVLGQPDEDD